MKRFLWFLALAPLLYIGTPADACMDGAGNCVRNTGVFTGAQSWQDTRDAGRRIRADDHDTHDESLATGIETAVMRDGQNQPTANLPMATFRHTGVGNAVDRDNYAAAGQIQDQGFLFVTAANVAGTADAITLAPSPAITSYAAGQRFLFLVEADNTGAVTVAVNGLAAQALTKNGADALVASEIQNGDLLAITYDGTRFQISDNPLSATTFIRTLLDDAAASNARTTLSAAGLPDANTFTADQTIDVTGALANLDIKSDVSADTSEVTQLEFFGHDDGANDTAYARLRTFIQDNTDTTEDGRLDLQVTSGGTADTTVASFGPGVLVGSATGGDQGASTLNASTLYDDGDQVYLLVNSLETEATTTSGTAFDFTGIRSVAEDARRITILFEGTSLSGTDQVIVQLGTSSAFATSGYAGGIVDSATGRKAYDGDGFEMNRGSISTDAIYGVLELRLMNASTNKWHGTTINNAGASGSHGHGAGTVSLSGALNQIRVTRDGTNTFDAGAVNVIIE